MVVITINDTTEFHLREKKAEMDKEYTVSHLLRKPTVFLGGETYGHYIMRQFKEQGMLAAKPRVLEIGPGLGDLAESAIGYLGKHHDLDSYTMLDLAPAFVDHLRSRFNSDRRVRVLQGDALQLQQAVGDGYDLLICNEIMGDLPTVFVHSGFKFRDDAENATLCNVTGGKLHSQDSSGDAQPNNPDEQLYADILRMFRTYYLWDVFEPQIAGGGAPFNWGAYRLLEQMPAVLAKGATVWIAETSHRRDDVDYHPEHWCVEEISLPGHNEYEVDFDYLKIIANGCGIRTQSTGPLYKFLKLPTDVGFIDPPGIGVIRATIEEILHNLGDSEVSPEVRRKWSSPMETLAYRPSELFDLFKQFMKEAQIESGDAEMFVALKLKGSMKKATRIAVGLDYFLGTND
jgi:hypothetical protein